MDLRVVNDTIRGFRIVDFTNRFFRRDFFASDKVYHAAILE